jgi:SAM-dependent methyltransferase
MKSAPLVDRAIVQELGPRISSLRIMDVGCATGRLLQRLSEAGVTQLFGNSRVGKATQGVPVDLRMDLLSFLPTLMVVPEIVPAITRS